MNDTTVDEFVTPDGTHLIANTVPNPLDKCAGCVFCYTERYGTNCIEAPGCCSWQREDNRDVIWVKPS